MSPVKDGLRDRPEKKPIIMENYYAALNYTETLEHENDHIMVRGHLHGEKETVTINAMIDSGATEDFIDQEVCNKHGINMIRGKKPKRDIPCGREAKRYGASYPYDESTYGH